MGLGSHQGNAWRRLVGGLNLTSMESGWRLVIVAPFSHNDSNLLREFGTMLVAWSGKPNARARIGNFSRTGSGRFEWCATFLTP
jgi:hypothetical protein